MNQRYSHQMIYLRIQHLNQIKEEDKKGIREEIRRYIPRVSNKSNNQNQPRKTKKPKTKQPQPEPNAYNNTKYHKYKENH